MESRQHIRGPGASNTGHGTAGSGPHPQTPSGTDVSVPDFHGATVGRSHDVLGIERRADSTSVAETSSPAKRVKKERGANWNPLEIKALIDAKRIIDLEEIDSVDGRDLMKPDANKRQRIDAAVVKAAVSPCLRDGSACKSKWNQITLDYKRISDFLGRSGTNELQYWELSAAERRSERLPRTFPQDVVFQINDWYGVRPTMQPLHCHDVLAPTDSNYRSALAESAAADEVPGSDYFFKNPVPIDLEQADNEDVSASTQSPMPIAGSEKMRTLLGLHRLDQGDSVVPLPKGTVPPGVTPHLLSSSDPANASPRGRPPNIGVQRKSLSSHSLIANAIRATGDAMVEHMKEMAEARRQLERSKIDVQLRLFSEQMEYRRERDRRLHDNAKLANENAKLAIENQGQVVQCLAQLSTVLTSSMHLQHATSTNALLIHQTAVNFHTTAQPSPASPTGLVDEDALLSARDFDAGGTFSPCRMTLP